MDFLSLPDSIFKLFVYVGISLTAYSFLATFKETEDYHKERVKYNAQFKKLENERGFLKKELSRVKYESNIFSKKHNLPNPLVVTDSGYTFIRTLIGDKISVSIHDSIALLLKQYDSKLIEIEKKEAELNVNQSLK